MQIPGAWFGNGKGLGSSQEDMGSTWVLAYPHPKEAPFKQQLIRTQHRLILHSEASLPLPISVSLEKAALPGQMLRLHIRKARGSGGWEKGHMKIPPLWLLTVANGQVREGQ
jgi:hypothetical protein